LVEKARCFALVKAIHISQLNCWKRLSIHSSICFNSGSKARKTTNNSYDIKADTNKKHRNRRELYNKVSIRQRTEES